MIIGQPLPERKVCALCDRNFNVAPSTFDKKTRPLLSPEAIAKIAKAIQDADSTNSTYVLPSY